MVAVVLFRSRLLVSLVGEITFRKLEKRKMQFFGEFKNLSEAAPSDTLGAEGLLDTQEFRNPVCGDRISVGVSFCDGKLNALRYRSQGCWPVNGCLELLSRKYLGQSHQQILEYRLEDFLAEVDEVPTSKRHAFSLAHRGVSAVVMKAWVLEKAGLKSGV